MVTLTNKSLPTPDIIRNLGLRFRDYRMRLRMTRKEVSVAARVGMTTLYKFESGNMTDISFGTVIRLLRAIGMVENWDALLPELPNRHICIMTMTRKSSEYDILPKSKFGSFELSEFIFAYCGIFTKFVIGNTNLLVQV